MLDTVVSDYYLDTADRRDLKGARENKRLAASAARLPLEGLRQDLRESSSQLTEYQLLLSERGWPVTELRILEVLIWIGADPRRQYLRIVDDGEE